MQAQSRNPYTEGNTAVWLVAIALGSLLARLLVLHYGQFEADAVSRIYMSLRWLEHPRWIPSGAWGPFHVYLLAAFLKLIPHMYWGPIICQLACACLAVFPLYWFCEREFGRPVALFATLAYAAYPVAFRYSLMPMAEVPFMFMLLSGLAFFSSARRSDGTMLHVLMAALFLNCAGAIRFEGWLFNLLLPLWLWRQWKKAAVFIVAGAVFPVAWVISNYCATGDALYFIHVRLHWNLVVEVMNSNLTPQELLFRFLFYPKSLFWGLTPFIGCLMLYGSALAVMQKKAEALWLAPPVILLGWIMMSAVDGSLVCAPRYAISVSVLLLPFAGMGFEALSGRLRGPRDHAVVYALLIGTMLPLSYCTKLPKLRNWLPPTIEAIPYDSMTDTVSRQVNSSLQPGDALMTDFYGWGQTYYVMLMTLLHPDNIFITPGGITEQMNFQRAETFLASHPKGVLIVANSQSKLLPPNDERAAGLRKNLRLEKQHHNELVTIYRYAWTGS